MKKEADWGDWYLGKIRIGGNFFCYNEQYAKALFKKLITLEVEYNEDKGYFVYTVLGKGFDKRAIGDIIPLYQVHFEECDGEITVIFTKATGDISALYW